MQSCPRCKERGTEGQLLKAPGDSVASCLQCGYEAVNIVSKPLPKKSTKWYCEKCDKYLRGQKWFDKHMAKHHTSKEGEEVVLPRTDTKGTWPEEFSIHPYPESSRGPFICPICKKVLTSRGRLDNHKKKYHNSERKQPHEREQSFSRQPDPIPFICSTCKKPFDSKQALNGHMATHSDRPTVSMGVLELTERRLRHNIMKAEGDEKEKPKNARRFVLQAIEELL